MAIKLSFLGATGNVTGSRFLVEADGAKVLVDCGLYQERKFADRNWDRFPVPPGEIDAVLLTHAHLDHCGLLPKLVKEGFGGKIHCTQATAEIAQIILLDSAHLQEEAAEYKKRRHKREGRKSPREIVPLYTTPDAERVAPMFAGIEYEQSREVAPGMVARYHDAGHVFGSSTISLTVSADGEKRTILFSGDVGRHNKPILENPVDVKHADYVLVETTYGDRVHKSVGDVKKRVADAINKAVKAGGNIIIPAFALERSQELLYHINELQIAKEIPQLMVFLDSPMAIRVTEVFKNHPEMFDSEMTRHTLDGESPFTLGNLKLTQTARESKAINHLKGSSIIIAGSGMCTGGRVKHHLVNNITREEATILFVGYQAEGTLGRRILEGAQEVRILGRMLPVRATVAKIRGFSAHADRNELCRWLSALQEPPRTVFTVHGEAGSSRAFADYLSNKTGWNVAVPEYKDTVVLD